MKCDTDEHTWPEATYTTDPEKKKTSRASPPRHIHYSAQPIQIRTRFARCLSAVGSQYLRHEHSLEIHTCSRHQSHHTGPPGRKSTPPNQISRVDSPCSAQFSFATTLPLNVHSLEIRTCSRQSSHPEGPTDSRHMETVLPSWPWQQQRLLPQLLKTAPRGRPMEPSTIVTERKCEACHRKFPPVCLEEHTLRASFFLLQPQGGSPTSMMQTLTS